MSERVIAPRSFLAYRGYRWLKVSLVAVTLASALYVGFDSFYDPPGGPNGGTWLGYGLGSLAAVLMLWLMWYGVRKRRYGTTGARLQGWLSAHVYVGTSLLAIALLHSGFQFGWNVHTLAFALMTAVIVTGIAGTWLYARIPERMTRNRKGETFEALLEQVATIDTDCRTIASGLPDPFVRALSISLNETTIGGGLLDQLAGRAPRDPTGRALRELKTADRHAHVDAAERENVIRLIQLVARKGAILARIRRDLRYKAWLDVWLILHVPLAFASLLAVASHVVTVFYYR
jgi:hypothetical protein